jgi:hypothetical protein
MSELLYSMKVEEGGRLVGSAQSALSGDSALRSVAGVKTRPTTYLPLVINGWWVHITSRIHLLGFIALGVLIGYGLIPTVTQ